MFCIQYQRRIASEKIKSREPIKIINVEGKPNPAIGSGSVVGGGEVGDTITDLVGVGVGVTALVCAGVGVEVGFKAGVGEIILGVEVGIIVGVGLAPSIVGVNSGAVERIGETVGVSITSAISGVLTREGFVLFI